MDEKIGMLEKKPWTCRVVLWDQEPLRECGVVVRNREERLRHLLVHTPSPVQWSQAYQSTKNLLTSRGK